MPKTPPPVHGHPMVKAGRLMSLTFRHWREDHCSLLAAGLAYYTLISLVPLSVIVLAVGGRALGNAASLGHLVPALSGALGPELAGSISRIVTEASFKGLVHATTLSVGLLIWAASIVFAHLQRALNIVWDVKPRPGVAGALLNRLMSFAMVLAVGFLFLGFAVLNAGMGLVRNFLAKLAPLLMERLHLWDTTNLVLFFVLQAVLWAVVFKFLPALKLAWRDVRVGAAVTALLTTLGVYLLKIYFREIPELSVFGAAASVMAVLIWVYFSTQIFLFGAEFTWAWAHLFGSRAGAPPPVEKPRSI
jgi:membrane protein